VAVRSAINGFGRIGRLAFRIAVTNYSKDINIVAINTSGSMDVKGWAHLLKYDTVYKKFEKDIVVEEVQKPAAITDQNSLIGYFRIDGKKYQVLAQRDPAKLPWKKLGVDVVIESTGQFNSEQKARLHIEAGAKKVLLSAPGKGGGIGTYVLGVNRYKGEGDIISNASCTTNSIAPVAAIMHQKFGVQKAVLTTVHAYTDDQRLVDNSHKDLRRARSAAQNIIPTTTGAAIAATETIPELKGLFDGIALRVPVVSGSVSDFTFLTKRKVTVQEVNEAFKEASKSLAWKNIISVTEEPIVSSDIVGTHYSTIVDLSFTKVIDGDLVKVLAWYDNEWAYAVRLVEQSIAVGKTIS
jgi:glyceraldehyde 3-phosphate dehydrogenase